jgi:hydroxymethylpyrimidine pyrophosphatase-like HAD family hydrolase
VPVGPVSDWYPRLVALDIDGTLLKWVEGAGTTYEQISPPVYDAVHRALDAGAHIVLASGRSPHGMTRIADLLDLHVDGGEPLWIVASNGAVVFRYPPFEVVHEETFDSGRGRGARRRLPREPAVPRRRAER